MRLKIRGTNLPGRNVGPYCDLYVGLQVGKEPEGLVAGDAGRAEWLTELQVVNRDVKGPAVQGRRGARFLYLTWGTLTDEDFTMFGRAKLMCADLPLDRAEVIVTINLSDERDMPRVARLPSDALHIS